MKISVILKGTPDSQGRKPVVIRTANGKARSFKATQIRVLPRQFKDGKITGHPQAVFFNQKIKKLIAETETSALNGETEKEAVPFYDYAERQLLQWESKRKPETVRSYRIEQRKIKEFAPGLNLQDITSKWLELYRMHLHKIGNCTNTQWKAFKFIRKILLIAIKEKLITDNPLEFFDAPKYRDPKKEYLTRSQVDALEKFARETPAKELSFCAGWFVISCYAGLRFSDMKAFNAHDYIRENRLVVHTVKTGEIVSMPVSSRLKSLFDLVGWKGMHYSNKTFNDYIKSAAALCGIKENVTAHMARHTAAVMWADAGMSEEVVAKLLAHSNLRSVRVYFKLTNSRIDNELKKLE